MPSHARCVSRVLKQRNNDLYEENHRFRHERPLKANHAESKRNYLVEFDCNVRVLSSSWSKRKSESFGGKRFDELSHLRSYRSVPQPAGGVQESVSDDDDQRTACASHSEIRVDERPGRVLSA